MVVAATVIDGDISGVPSAQLSAVVEQHLDVDLGTLAQRAALDKKYLKRLVINPTVPVIRLGMADRILMALDPNLSLFGLIQDGELTIVPVRNTRAAAMRIVNEEIWVNEEYGLPEFTKEEIDARVEELLALYDEHCGLTEKMVERREADKLRKVV